MRPTIGKNNGHIQHIHRLPGKQRTFCSGRFSFVIIFNIVIQQVLQDSLLASFSHRYSQTHVVPVGASHLKTPSSPLTLVRAVANDICKRMTSFPVARANSLVPFHHILLGEIIPRSEQFDRPDLGFGNPGWSQLRSLYLNWKYPQQESHECGSGHRKIRKQKIKDRWSKLKIADR
jgi:hypothetical protein